MNRRGLSRTDRLLFGIVLVAALLVALVTWLVVPPEKSGGLVKQPSTFFNVAYGTKAAYLVLDRLRYPVARLRRPIGEGTLESVGILVVLRPVSGLRDFEIDYLESWVREGHALVVVPGRSHLEASEKAGAERTQRKDVPVEPSSFFEEWFALDEMASRREGEENIRAHAAKGRPESGVEVDSGEPICAGIRELAAESDCRFGKSPLRGPLAESPAKTFWSDDLGTVGLRAELGQGTIIALADPYPLTNLGIGDADNGLLLGNMVRELSRQYPGEVAFDEHHQGFAERDWSAVAMAKLMLSGPWRWAVIQVALVGLLALYAAAVRFGSPQDVVYKPRRQHREFAEAAGRLLNEAGAVSLAATTLLRHYRDRLCRLVHLEPDADDVRLGQAVRDRSGQQIDELLQQARPAASGPVGRQELLAITRKLHRALEALDHGT